MIRSIAKTVKRLLTYMEAVRWELILGLVGFSLNGLLTTWMLAKLLGDAVAAYEQKSVPLLVQAILLALPWLGITMLVQSVSTWFCGKATAAAATAMRKQLMDTMLKSPVETANAAHSGLKLSYFTNDIPAAVDSLINSLEIPLSAVFMGVGGLVFVLKLHWSIAVAVVILGAVTYTYSIYFADLLHKTAVRMQTLVAELEIRIKTLLDGMVTVRLYNMEDVLGAQMDESADRLMKTGVYWAKVSGLLGGINNGFGTVITRIIVFLAGLVVLADIMDMPTFMTASQMAGSVAMVFMMNRALIGIERSAAGAQRVFDYLDTAQEEQSGAYAGGDETAQWAVAFDHVGFGYDTDRLIVQDFSLKVKPGQLVAIVGASGSGKSTLLRLIQGLYRPASGQVAVLGHDVADWDLARLRAVTALVPQEPVLMTGTIAENIAIGSEYSREEMIAAAKDACAHEFIMTLPQGYDTPVTERGMSLSGGQRQRIALARALLQQAPILLLDEATSAVDSLSEADIHQTLTALKGKKTILFVTHRAMVLELSDKVVHIK